MSTYDIDGKKLASVTTVIGDCSDKSDALTKWAANMVVEWIKKNCRLSPFGHCGDRYLSGDDWLVSEDNLNEARTHFRDVSQEALDIGSAVHDAIHQWFKTGKEPFKPSDQVLSGFLAFLEWADEHKVKHDKVEFTVTDFKYSAGTLDFVGWIDDKYTVVDFKSSKAIYPEYRYQIAAYRYMYNLDINNPTVHNSGILRLDKETGFPEYKDYSKKYDEDLAVYQAMVNLYYLRHPRIAKGAGLPF